MYGKPKALMTGILFLCLLQTVPVFALTAQDYLNSGRASLFDGTLSGIRQAHDTFEQGINDGSCLDCQTHRQLLFFHAISRIAMWVVREDGLPTNSALEIAKEYGTTVTGEALRQIMITEPNYPENRYGQPIIPADYQQLIAQFVAFMETAGMPELESVLAELEQISETPEDLFRVFLTPQETSIFIDLDDPALTTNIEVDYADVLMLKGMLYTAKGVLTAKSAYNTHVDPQDRLYEKLWEDCLSIENDLLLPHPDFLKLLPTANDPNDGTAILAQARLDIRTGLQYYFQLLNCIQNENIPQGTDPQDDELFSIDLNDIHISDQIKNKLMALNDSLNNDTAFTAEGKIRITYELANSSSQSLAVQLTKGPFGNILDAGLSFDAGNHFAFDDSEAELLNNQLSIYLDSYSYGYVGGFFTGTLSPDHSMITNASFEYWGSVSGDMQNLSGPAVGQETEGPWTVDPNPILGDSPRYPNPISPRNYLPSLDQWNKPVPGSLPDVALGGILPEATETDWLHWIDPQPNGTLLWPAMQTWQMYAPAGSYDLWPAFWLDEQRVFTDSIGDVQPTALPMLDIEEFYLGSTTEMIYGSFLFHDHPGTPSYNGVYRFYLSHCPNNPEAPGSMMVEIDLGEWQAYLFYRSSEFGSSQWDYICNIDFLVFPNQLDFRIPLYSIPGTLSGRYLSIESHLPEDLDSSICQEQDKNDTHLQIGMVGSISGRVQFPGYLGGPIFVQAYSDPHDPENSLVACAMLDGPGPFVLKNIGLGWEGCIRAFCPLFGEYHPLDMDAIKAEHIKPMVLRTQNLRGISLVLQNPSVLETDRDRSDWVEGWLDIITSNRNWFAFDAIGGITYRLMLSRETASYAVIELLDRNGHDVLQELDYWQYSLNWICPVNGRYYIRVSDPQIIYYANGSYKVKVLSSWNCPEADISGDQWVGVKDCRIDLNDFVLLASQWLSDCSSPYWCQESDYDQSGSVQTTDLLHLINEWLAVGYEEMPQNIKESFETGDFSTLPWQFGGYSSWYLTTDTAYEGSYSLRSGPLGPDEYNQVYFTLDTSNYTTIRFAHKTECQGWDYLIFYINGVEQAFWPDWQDWTEQTFSISPGLNTFTWYFLNESWWWDGYYSGYIWIDNIVFE